MRFFGYYALHSFVNQLKKLCKTWVLVFFAVCLLIGGIIGFGAAMLEDTVEATQEPEAVTSVEETPEEDEGTELPISPEGLIELIAGGCILAFFLFQAFCADKNGSRIFLPADVNLLFPSPMKPQSVLMFRLGTQLGTALLASVWISFQLPNLMLNAGLTGWGAAALLICWFATVLIGKLIQVMLYTICATHRSFKKHLRDGIYGFCALIALGFFAYFKASGEHPLVAADQFFNAGFTWFIPFWGWMKGFAMCFAAQSWLAAGMYFVLLAAGSTGLVYIIWNIKADFYEDAMAKSEETAALLEKAASEKTSGTAVARKRKKDRSEKLKRDGMNHGWGASVFFHKSMYNRFRFAHLGFLTKTMETYFVAAVGLAAALRFFFGTVSELPVVLTLGALVFFRALGNPLAEDTGMDFFRLIPESAWQKLFYSLLAGTVNCLLDLILPMLAASAVLMVNPLKLLLWLPLILSVDFYSSSVVTFIDQSVPASIGKTIKTLITILFIYFGLLPDIGILAFGIVLGYTAEAAISSTVFNLALGLLALSLASVFIQPKGRDYIATVKDQDLKAASRNFSRLGLAVLAILAVVTVLQLALALAIEGLGWDVSGSSWGIWLLTFAPQYLVGVPVGLLLMRKVPAHVPQKNRLGAARGVKFGFICLFLMYGGNLLGIVVTTLLGLLTGSAVMNPLMDYVDGQALLPQFLFIVVLAPLIEEFVFRKQLIDRMRIYGGKTAVVLSALLFGLFHGNFSQFFYAFFLGLAFGYIYLNTGCLRYSVIAHMVINFMGSILSMELLKRLEAAGENAMDPWVLTYFGYAALLVIGSIVGLVLLCMNKRKLHYPAGELELPRGKRFAVTCVNTGMILIFLACLAMTLTTIL